MILYGSNKKELSKEIITDICPSCGKSNVITLTIYQKYAQIFWIPFFPLKKTGESLCGHCKQKLELKEMPSSFKMRWESLKSTVRTPIWTFSGIVILGLLIVREEVSDKMKLDKSSKYITNLKIGDILEVKNDDDVFTIHKIDKISTDSIYVRLSKYESLDKLKLDDLRDSGDNSYTKKLYSFSKKEIAEKFNKGIIIGVDRK